MVTTNFWLTGLSALFVVIFGIIVGLFALIKSIKTKQKLLRNFGIMAILMGLLLLGPATDFLYVIFTTISTGTGSNIDFILYVRLSYMWVAPGIVFMMWIGGELLAPKAKWYIVGIYSVIGIIFEFFLFNDLLTENSFKPYDPPLGEDVIDASFNTGALPFIIIVILILSVLLFDGIGSLRKAKQLTGELRKRFLYLTIGFFLFTIAAVMDALLAPGPVLFISRFGFMADNVFLYYGLVITTKKIKAKKRRRLKRARREVEEKARRESEERARREEREKINYENIQNLKDLIRNYVYHQLKAIQNDFKSINLEDLEQRIKNQLNSEIDTFVNYLKLEGYSLTQFQTELLKDDCFKESKPIRDELRILIKDYLETKQIRRAREEQERIMREKVEITKRLFGKEILKEEDIEKIEEYKTIDDKIDDLMKEYSAWERKEDKKKL